MYDHGTALIYIDGKLVRRVDGITFAPTDVTAPGRLGANSGLYEAVGDVTLTADALPAKARRLQNYVGDLGEVRVFNRALAPAEIAALAGALP